jgi:hypothetical protein
MDYPPNLVLDDYTKQRLISYLNDELYNHDGERGSFLNLLTSYQNAYWAEPETGVVTFPFENASQIIIPLDAIAVEATHSRTMNTAFGLSQFVSAKAIHPDWSESDSAFEHFFDHELLHTMKAYKVFDTIILEIEKYGTGIGKSGYEKIVKYAIREAGGVSEEFPVIIKDGATLSVVPLGRFLMPYTANSPENSPWCGEEHSEVPYVFKQLVDSGLFYEDAFDKVMSYVDQLSVTNAQNSNKMEAEQQSLEGREPFVPDRLNWVEIKLSFNVDGNDKNKEREIVVHYHRDAQELLSVRNNWYADLRREYRTGVWFPVEHRWAGIGIIKQTNQFQEEVTQRTRQQLDNATLANVRMIKVSRLSGIGPGEPIFPGKIWSVDDMTHVDTFQLGEIYPSSYNTVQQAVNFAQMRNGINEITLGQPGVGTPGTASEELSRVQEGNKKFGYHYKNIKELINELITDVACNIHQFGSRTIEFLDYLPGGDVVKQTLQLPETYIRDGLLIQLTSAGQQENKLIDRQNWLQISQIFQSWVMSKIQLEFQIFQMTQGSNAQELMKVIGIARTGGEEVMKQILESFDTRNINRIIGGGANATQQGGNQQSQNTGAPTGMAGTPQLLAPIQGGGVAPSSGVQIGR